MKDVDINKLVRKNILEIIPYSTARDEYKANGSNIFLDANENPFNNGMNRYPDPRQIELKKKIASIKNLSIENIFLGNGSDDIIDLLIRAFCEPGKDKIMITPPTYGMYEVLAQINNNGVDRINLNSDFEPDLYKMINVADKNLKILFLCIPNNPTGNSFNEKTVETMLKNLDCIVVIDEAYQDFSDKKSWISRLDEFPNLVVMQTFSKARGLAGIRLGMAFASKQILNILNRIKLPYNINNLTLNIVSELLENQDEFENQVKLIKEEKQKLTEKMSCLSSVLKVYPSDSNFILCKMQDATNAYNYLMHNGIIVRNRSGQLNCDNCLRITVGTPDENNMLIKFLEEYDK